MSQRLAKLDILPPRCVLTRIYENGMVPPILNPDGTINRGYGSDIEFDTQGEFVGIAANIYRISRLAEALAFDGAQRLITNVCFPTTSLDRVIR